ILCNNHNNSCESVQSNQNKYWADGDGKRAPECGHNEHFKVYTTEHTALLALKALDEAVGGHFTGLYTQIQYSGESRLQEVWILH
ncbi:hypothetical protein BGX21_006914, partial [Mortierella sp. AD011]